MRQSILFWIITLLFCGTSSLQAAVTESFESSTLQSTFNAQADQSWIGDLSAFAIQAADWPDGANVFGANSQKAIRSANASMSAADQYTVVTDVTGEIAGDNQIEWSAYVSGNSISIQGGYEFHFILLANTSDPATIESQGTSFQGYRLTVSQRTVNNVTSDYLSLWKCSGSDSNWVPLQQIDLGSAWLNGGWNLKVVRSQQGLWTVSYANGVKGNAPEVAFSVTDTSVNLDGGSWYCGMTWVTKGTSHANKFGFDDLNVTGFIPPNEPPVAEAGNDQLVQDDNDDGLHLVLLDGSDSTDADGSIVSYVWSENAAAIATGESAAALLSVGEHTITLTVNDDDGDTDTDTLFVTVLDYGPQPPVADAGPDQRLADRDGDGSETVTLDGSASTDYDSPTLLYIWQENNSDIAVGVNPQVTLGVGTHTITLLVVDGDELTDSDTVIIEVIELGPTTTSITQHGITWTFDQPTEFGQFVNGDYWVIGPVNVIATSPAPTTSPAMHGSMINPSIGDGQGYDSRVAAYNAANRVSFPVTLQSGDALMTSISWNDEGPHTDLVGANPTNYVRTAAVLTCLDIVPPEGSFRPPYTGTNKPLFNVSDIRYDRLARLAKPGDASYNYSDIVFGRNSSMTIAGQFNRYFQRPWLLHVTDWSGRDTHPTENMPNYHREVYRLISDASCLLLLDLPDIDELLIPFLQLGIDSHYIIKTGGGNGASDADSSIHKWPVLFAGIMFDNAAMRSNGYRYRTEWMSYYIVDGSSPYASSVVPAGWTWTGYQVGWRQDPGTQEHEHLDPDTEWHLVSDGGGSKRESYRRINSHSWPGPALAAHVMQAVEDWDHQAFFDYVDRWMTEPNLQPQYSPTVGSTSSGFVTRMWNLYRDYQPDQVAGRFVFYNDSSFDGNNPAVNVDDDNAIAADKAPLLPEQIATSANYTSYVKGLNGIMVDLPDLSAPATASDFEFKVGNDADPAGWAAAPTPTSITTRIGEGADGSDRVTIAWSNGAIKGKWLQVTVKANTITNLNQDDVFYFGNAVGDTGNSTADTLVDTTDQIAARNNPRHFLNPALIDNPNDHNRDGKVDATDEIICRNNATDFTSQLILLESP